MGDAKRATYHKQRYLVRISAQVGLNCASRRPQEAKQNDLQKVGTCHSMPVGGLALVDEQGRSAMH